MRCVSMTQEIDSKPANKEETELPIGEPTEPDERPHHFWRCSNCGETGRLADELPATCPNCGGPKEELYYREED